MGGAPDQGTLTILFTDVEGSTAFRTRAGDAAGNRVMIEHERLVAEQVALHEGRLVKSLGDGCLAVFASPRRAVECAVVVQRAASDSPLRVRMGLNAGEVTLAGEDVFGAAVNAAARIAAKAQGGEVFISDVVRQLMGTAALSGPGGLELRDRGRVRLRGFPERWRLYEVVWRDERAAAGNPELTPFVGRAAEMARLHRVLDNLRTGRGAAVVIRGEAGIGKTRLATEALDVAHARGWRVLTGRASPFGGGLGLEPVIEAFGGLLRALPPEKLHALAGDLPHLSRLFEGVGLPPAAPVLEPTLERTLLLESVARLLERLARQTPTVLMIDDVQWADPASLELIHQLGRGIECEPAALVLTYRPGEPGESDRLRQLFLSLRRQRVVEEIDLARLDAQSVEALAREFLGGRFPRRLLDILGRAAGTPLFVDALLRGLLDRGQLTRAGDVWTLSDGAIEVPTAVRDLILERLDGLDAGARRVVELVALTGASLPYDVLAAVPGVTAAELDAVVEDLAAAGLLAEEAEAELAFRLTHPLYYEVAEGRLTQVARRRAHAELANAFEFAAPGDVEALARHYLAAGSAVDRVRGLAVLAEAGGRAVGRRTYAEALRFLDAAVALARQDDATLLPGLLEQLAEARNGVGLADAAREAWTELLTVRQREADTEGTARVLRLLAMAEFERGHLEAAVGHLDDAAGALEGTAPGDELADVLFTRVIVLNRLSRHAEILAVAAELERVAAALRTDASAARAHYAWAVGLTASGRVADAWEHARVGLDHAAAADDRDVAFRLHTAACDAALFLGDHASLLAHGQELIRLFGALGLGVLAGGASLYRVWATLLSGAWEAASAYSDAEADRVARQDNERRAVPVLSFRAWVLAWRGDLTGAAAIVADLNARVTPEMFRDRRGFGIAPMAEAILAVEQGDPARAHAVLEAAWGASGDPLGWLMISLAEARARSGDPAAVERAMAALPTFDSPFLHGVTDYVQGLVHAAQGAPAAAAGAFAASAETFDRLAMPFHAARSRLDRARALAGDDPAAAVAEAGPALEAFRRLGAKLYAERAATLLATLGVRSRATRPAARPAARTGGLSERQVEVSRLVAQGLTNAEIAQTLTLSVRTITSHLDHIYTRLGITSRAELAHRVAAHPADFA